MEKIAAFFFACVFLSGILFVRYGWWAIPLGIGICFIGLVVVSTISFTHNGDENEQ